MNLHRLAELRSIEFHRAVAARLRAEPGLLDSARAQVRGWSRSALVSPGYAEAWARALDLPMEALCALLVDAGEEATAMRQATPFAGVIPPRERWKIWREVRLKAEEDAL